jgi:RNA polymerase sigma factor (sigma-70 family)
MARDENQSADLDWVTPHYDQLRTIAQARHRRLPWIMEVNDLLHDALLRWAPGQGPLPSGAPLNSRQLATFSLTCLHVLINELRKQARWRKRFEELARGRDSSQVSPERSVELKDLVESLLSQLREREREVLQGRYFRGLSFRRIARRLHCTPELARQIHHRAIVKLRDLLVEQGLL